MSAYRVRLGLLGDEPPGVGAVTPIRSLRVWVDPVPGDDNRARDEAPFEDQESEW
jgi:hypothetical protein